MLKRLKSVSMLLFLMGASTGAVKSNILLWYSILVCKKIWRDNFAV